MQLRSAGDPWGHDRAALTQAQSEKVAEGNRTLRGAVALARHLHANGMPWVLEHPYASSAFSTAELQSFQRLPMVHVAVVDQCRYGTQWRKRTKLLAGHVPSDDLAKLSLRCTGSGGWCSSGRRRFVLEGRGRDGRPVTAAAQGYPHALARAFSAALTSLARSHAYNNM